MMEQKQSTVLSSLRQDILSRNCNYVLARINADLRVHCSAGWYKTVSQAMFVNSRFCFHCVWFFGTLAR